MGDEPAPDEPFVAESIWQTVLRAAWESIVKLVNDGGLAIASNVALSLLLSLFPFLMLIASLVRFYGNPELAAEVVDLLLGHWPGDAAQPARDLGVGEVGEPQGVHALGVERGVVADVGELGV